MHVSVLDSGVPATETIDSGGRWCFMLTERIAEWLRFLRQKINVLRVLSSIPERGKHLANYNIKVYKHNRR